MYADMYPEIEPDRHVVQSASCVFGCRLLAHRHCGHLRTRRSLLCHGGALSLCGFRGMNPKKLHQARTNCMQCSSGNVLLLACTCLPPRSPGPSDLDAKGLVQIFGAKGGSAAHKQELRGPVSIRHEVVSRGPSLSKALDLESSRKFPGIAQST